MTNFPDMVTQFGGMPVGGGRYEAMWGSKVYFVDYENGTESAGGLKPSNACKYLQDAIDLADVWDVIYVRPRTPALDGGDPQKILPESTTNNSIANTKYGLSIIGTGTGRGVAGQTQTLISGGAVTTTTPVLNILAPYTTLENLGFKPGASTVGLVHSESTSSTVSSFQNTFYNCWFRDNTVVGSATYGAIFNEASWYDNIIGCTFSGCVYGVYVTSIISNVTGLVIRNCDFDALAATVKADIYTSGTVTRIAIDGCRFNHTVPSGGSPNRYVSIAAASTGLIADCWSGAAAATVANYYTLNGLNYSHLHGGNNVNIATT